jgi:putative endonuclease
VSRRAKNLGDWGERKAVEFLKRHGFKIVEQNYYTTVGEIDIVAIKGGDLYFIEVKTRCGESDLANDLTITKNKKSRLSKAIRHYCYHRQIANKSLILAGLVLAIDNYAKIIKFRFCVFY